MASDTKNIQLGSCRVFFGGEDLGFTIGGVEVEVSTNTKKTQVDQFGDTTVNEYVQGRDVMARVPMAETTLDNMVRIMPGATLVSTGGTKASGTITFATNASADDTITINGKVFTFKASPSNAYEIEVGGSTAITLDNIVARLEASMDRAVGKADYTEDGSTVLTVTYFSELAEGNDFTLAASAASVSGATLSGGVDGKKRVDVETAIGTSLLDTAKELRLHPVVNDEDDVSEDFYIVKANTAGALSFAYKKDEERVFNVEFTGYPDPNTGELFKVGDKTA